MTRWRSASAATTSTRACRWATGWAAAMGATAPGCSASSRRPPPRRRVVRLVRRRAGGAVAAVSARSSACAPSGPRGKECHCWRPRLLRLAAVDEVPEFAPALASRCRRRRRCARRADGAAAGGEVADGRAGRRQSTTGRSRPSAAQTGAQPVTGGADSRSAKTGGAGAGDGGRSRRSARRRGRCRRSASRRGRSRRSAVDRGAAGHRQGDGIAAAIGASTTAKGAPRSPTGKLPAMASSQLMPIAAHRHRAAGTPGSLCRRWRRDRSHGCSASRTSRCRCRRRSCRRSTAPLRRCRRSPRRYRRRARPRWPPAAATSRRRARRPGARHRPGAAAAAAAANDLPIGEASGLLEPGAPDAGRR